VWPLAIAAVVIVGLVLRSARRLLLTLIAWASGLAIVGAGYIWYAGWRNDRDLQRRRALIPRSAVEIHDARLAPQRYGGYAVSGRIFNRSQYELGSATLRIRIMDCNARAACEVVEDRVMVVEEDVPPGQARDFTQPLLLVQPPTIRGTLKWGFEIVGTEAAF